MLQLSWRTMFLGFYRVILPLLMSVSFNSENIAGLPIQAPKPHFKGPKEEGHSWAKVRTAWSIGNFCKK